MKLEFHPDAADEFDSAVRFYDQQQAGLGVRLRDSVAAAIESAMQNPGGGAISEFGTRFGS